MKPDYILFTDASHVSDRPENEIASGIGVVILNMETNKYTSYGKPTSLTNVTRIELRAVLDALRSVRKINKKKRLKILLVTDSMYIITKYGKYNEFTDFKDVKRIMDFVKHYRYQFKMVHISSHKYNKPEKLIKFAEDYKRRLETEFNITGDKTAELFIHMNRMADLNAKSVITKYRKQFKKGS